MGKLGYLGRILASASSMRVSSHTTYLPPCKSISRLWLVFIGKQVDFVFCGFLLRTILTVSILGGFIRLRLISRTVPCPLGGLRLL